MAVRIERVGCPSHQPERSAPEEQEAGGEIRTVQQRSKRREEPGAPLDLVHDDEARERRERDLGIGQATEISLALEIEDMGLRFRCGDLLFLEDPPSVE